MATIRTFCHLYHGNFPQINILPKRFCHQPWMIWRTVPTIFSAHRHQAHLPHILLAKLSTTTDSSHTQSSHRYGPISSSRVSHCYTAFGALYRRIQQFLPLLLITTMIGHCNHHPDGRGPCLATFHILSLISKSPTKLSFLSTSSPQSASCAP